MLNTQLQEQSGAAQAYLLGSFKNSLLSPLLSQGRVGGCFSTKTSTSAYRDCRDVHSMCQSAHVHMSLSRAAVEEAARSTHLQLKAMQQEEFCLLPKRVIPFSIFSRWQEKFSTWHLEFFLNEVFYH